MIDAHFHFFAFSYSFLSCNFSPNEVRSITHIKNKISNFAKHVPRGNWIRAGVYDEFYLNEKRHPNRMDLDDATSEHPVWLIHRSGHACVLNSTAMKLAGISSETPEPSGAIINRDIYTGEPDGILFDMNPHLSKIIPSINEEHRKKQVRLANQYLLSLGITSLQDASSNNSIHHWRWLKEWKRCGDLKCRITVMLGYQEFTLCRQQGVLAELIKDEQIKIRGVKIILNETTGQMYPSQSELNKMVLEIHESGLQAVIHAIEERSIEAACTAIEECLRKSPRSDHRHRVEHCSVCPPSLSKRIASLGIIVVTQPAFLYFNGDRYLRTVPNEELAHLYPIATLIQDGVKVAGSSDGPIVPANPLIGIYSAVSRMSDTGRTILAKENITISEAFRMFTFNAAKAAFEESSTGSISPGKLADLVVLSDNPMKTSIGEIKNIQIEMTILNGEIVWEKNR
jgi:predicted amidohydrolase YtcJ